MTTGTFILVLAWALGAAGIAARLIVDNASAPENERVPPGGVAAASLLWPLMVMAFLVMLLMGDLS